MDFDKFAEKQPSLGKAIEAEYNNHKKDGRFTNDRLESRIRATEQHWKMFMENNGTMLASMEPEDEDHPYVKD